MEGSGKRGRSEAGAADEEAAPAANVDRCGVIGDELSFRASFFPPLSPSHSQIVPLESVVAELKAEMSQYQTACSELAARAAQHIERVAALQTRLLNDVQVQTGAALDASSRIDELRARIVASGGGSPLRLNVGGAQFQVARCSVQKYPLSYFGLLLEGEEEEVNAEHFVDRSPHEFELVLDFLRGINLHNRLALSDRQGLEKLSEEARFYGLEELGAVISEELQERWVVAPTVNGQLLDGGLTLVKTGDMGSRACISLGTAGWAAGVHEFSIVFAGDGAHVGVGVARGGVHQTDLLRNVQLFYALDCGNGRAIGAGGIAKQVVDHVAPTGFAAHSRVSVRIDLDQRTVTFGLNGNWLEPAFSNIAPAIYYPYFFLGSMEKRLTVVR